MICGTLESAFMGMVYTNSYFNLLSILVDLLPCDAYFLAEASIIIGSLDLSCFSGWSFSLWICLP